MQGQVPRIGSCSAHSFLKLGKVRLGTDARDTLDEWVPVTLPALLPGEAQAIVPISGNGSLTVTSQAI